MAVTCWYVHSGNFITAEIVNQHDNSVNGELANRRFFGTASQGDTLPLERGTNIKRGITVPVQFAPAHEQ